jgi:hypothetical protein
MATTGFSTGRATTASSLACTASLCRWNFELARSRQTTGGGCDRGRCFSPSLSTRWQLANCVMKSPACDAMVQFDLGRVGTDTPEMRSVSVGLSSGAWRAQPNA